MQKQSREMLLCLREVAFSCIVGVEEMTKEGTVVSEKTRMIADAEHGASGNKLYRVAASLAMALVLLCGLLWPFGSDSLTTTVPQLNALLSASRPTVNAAAPHDSGMTASSKGIKVTQVDGVWVATRNGVIDTSYTGVAQNGFGWWYVRRGKVDFSYTGIAGNQFGYWYIRTGQVDFSMNGRVSALGTNWTVTNGSAVGDIPTRVSNAFVNAGADTGSYQSGHDYCSSMLAQTPAPTRAVMTTALPSTRRRTSLLCMAWMLPARSRSQ